VQPWSDSTRSPAWTLTVLYAVTVRPFDAGALRRAVTASDSADVVLVEPYLAGTSAREVDQALLDLPHRVLGLGVGRAELRRYGTPAGGHRARCWCAAGQANGRCR
jgi:transketolase